MNWYTVEVTLKPVRDDDWTQHLCAIEAVPGTVLIQDAEAPVLAFPVEADQPFAAARFVEGVLSFLELDAISGEISDMPARDFDVEHDRPRWGRADHSGETKVIQAIHSWMGDTPAFPRTQDRELIDS
jgi:hypothetical protein